MRVEQYRAQARIEREIGPAKSIDVHPANQDVAARVERVESVGETEGPFDVLDRFDGHDRHGGRAMCRLPEVPVADDAEMGSNSDSFEVFRPDSGPRTI